MRERERKREGQIHRQRWRDRTTEKERNGDRQTGKQPDRNSCAHTHAKI